MSAKLPCAKCTKNISKNSYKIGCMGSCKQWYHRECSGLSESEIDELSKGKYDFFCIMCKVSTAEANPDLAFYDAIENMNIDKKMDSSVFRYILQQKDIIISELRDKIEILNDQIDLLKEFSHEKIPKTTVCEKNLNSKNSEPSTKTKSTINDKKPCSIKNRHTPANLQAPTSSSSVGLSSVASMPKATDDPIISNQQVSYAILQAKTNQICRTYVDLAKEDAPKDSKTENWKLVPKKRKQRDIVVGNNEKIKVNGKEVMGVPKFTSLHVYRVDPTITAEELTDMVKVHFPEVKTEKINSKYPELYSSFKVNVYMRNYENAMDPSKWPTGAYVQRFLYLQRKTGGPMM